MKNRRVTKREENREKRVGKPEEAGRLGEFVEPEWVWENEVTKLG